jgi:hypothetical protein
MFTHMFEMMSTHHAVRESHGNISYIQQSAWVIINSQVNHSVKLILV